MASFGMRSRSSGRPSWANGWLLAGLLVLGVPSAARAGVIYTLGYSTCTTACGSAPWGTVTVTQDAANWMALDVVVQLANDPTTGLPYYFHQSNSNHFALAFSLVGNQSATISGLNPSVYGVNSGTSFTAAGLGTFGFAMSCQSTLGCANGYSATNGGRIGFTITPTSGSLNQYSAFAQNSNGYFFSTDIAALINGTGSTGNIGSSPATGVQYINKPASVLSLLMMLGLFGFIRRGRICVVTAGHRPIRPAPAWRLLPLAVRA